jgi:hypothetical protein
VALTGDIVAVAVLLVVGGWYGRRKEARKVAAKARMVGLSLIPSGPHQPGRRRPPAHRPRHVRSLVRGQEQDHAHLFVDAAVAVHQARRDGLVDDCLVPRLSCSLCSLRVARNPARRRLGAARGHGVDADAVGRVSNARLAVSALTPPLAAA